MNRVVACAVVVYVAVASVSGQQGAAKPKPASRADTVEAGRQLFDKTCKLCHGEAGIGNRAPALRGAKFTAAFVRSTVTTGVPGTMMPKFQVTLASEQIEQVAEYIASLQRPDSVWAMLRGDAVAGQKVFFDESNAHSCATCHTFKGEGGHVGPDLSARLARQSAREIFQKIIVVPHRSVEPAYVNVAIVTSGGERLTGITAEETDDSVHFYDTSSLPPTLKTLLKREIVSTKKLNASPMPSDYSSRLSLKQLLDLVAFLRTAGAGQQRPLTFSDLISGSPAAGQ